MRHPISGLNMNLHWKRFTKPLMSLIFQTVMKWFSADTERYPFRIRLNTNGLSDLIHKRSTAEEICQAVDSISISLNMPDAASYNEVVRPAYGEKSFDAMLKFARDCKQYLDDVRFTVVDVIGEEKVEQSKILAAQNGIPCVSAYFLCYRKLLRNVSIT